MKENKLKSPTQVRADQGGLNCDKTKDLAEYEVHLETHIQHQTYNCGKYDSKYASLSDINYHVNQQHNKIVVIPVETESLQSCGDEANGEGVTVIPDSFQECRKSQMKFENSDALKKHMTDDHIILNVYNCTLCQFKSTGNQKLKMHLKTTHTEAVNLVPTPASRAVEDNQVKESETNLQSIFSCDKCDETENRKEIKDQRYSQCIKSEQNHQRKHSH